MAAALIQERKAAVLARLNVAGLVSELFSRCIPAGKNQVLVLCPVHSENSPSCSVNTESGLWNCKACDARGNLFDLVAAVRGCDFIAALEHLEARTGIAPLTGQAKENSASNKRHLPKQAGRQKPGKAQTASRAKGKTVAVYRYFDTAGEYRYQKKRIEPGREGRRKEFCFSHPLPDGTEAPGRGECPPLLYGLPRLVAAPPGEPIFIVEGEGKVDALAAFGLFAACTDSGAKSKWPVGFEDLFTGRPVVILPDNDAPGEEYSETVAAALLPVAASVQVLRLPVLPEKGDIIDLIKARLGELPPQDGSISPAAEALRSELLHQAKTAPPWEPVPAPAVLITPDEAEKENRPARRQEKEERETRGGPRLLALMENAPLYVDPQSNTYVELGGDIFPLEAKHPLLFETVSDLHYSATGQTIGKDSLAAAVAVLSYRARREGHPAPLANRACFWDEALYYDLGNGRAARIAGGAWEIVPAKVGLFRAWPHKRPHPDPVADGDPWRLFRSVHVTPEARPFVLATLAACLFPGIARPALVITGPQGSGKSTAARYFKLALDPGHPALTLITRKPEDLDLLLARHFVLALDNLSNMPPDLADTLSAIITGAAPQRRALHTDNELITLHTDVTICLNGITSLTDRPDFMERTLKIELERIEDAARLADDELDEAFSADLPEILGGLLSLLARGLKIFPEYRPPRLPRMAAFARIAAAIAEGMELGGGEAFLAEFFRNQGAQHLQLAEGNLFFAAILETCAAGDYPEGTFKQVVATLKELADPGPKDPFPTARGLRRALERLRVPLNTAGIGFEIIDHRTATGKASVRFFAMPKPGETPPSDPATHDTETPPELSGLVFDEGELDP